MVALVAGEIRIPFGLFTSARKQRVAYLFRHWEPLGGHQVRMMGTAASRVDHSVQRFLHPDLVRARFLA